MATTPQAQTPAPTATTPLPPSIVKIRDAKGVMHEFDLGKLDEKQGADLFALLPTERQKLALEQKSYFMNYKHEITDIPASLLEPGAIEKCMEMLRKQGGYIANDASQDVKDFLNGPYCAELRRTGLYKGMKSTSELAGLMASGGELAIQSLVLYFSALSLPFRAIGATTTEVKEALDSTRKVTDAQALALAAAYQGGLYMATESEGTKREPRAWETALDHVKTSGGFLWQYIAVPVMALWNMITKYDTKKEFSDNVESAWETAKKDHTKGKGFSTYEAKLAENARERTEKTVRPEIETMLSGIGTVAGVDATPYMQALKKNDTHYAGHDRKVYQIKGGKPVPTPVPGPNGQPLTQSDRTQHTLDGVKGGLFEDIGPNINTTASVIGVTAAGANYKGVTQGIGEAYASHATHSVDKKLKKAQNKLKDVEGRAQQMAKTFEDHAKLASEGKKPPFWSREPKPEDVEKLKNELQKAQEAVEELKDKKAKLPTNTIEGLKTGNWFERKMGSLAEAAQKELPANAKWPAKAIHSFVGMGQWVGNGIGHAGISVARGAVAAFGVVKDGAVFAAEKTKSLTAGVVHSTAEALLPKQAAAKVTNLTAGLAEIVNKTEAAAGAGGKLLGKAGDVALKTAIFVSPVKNIAHANAENDKVGIAIYGAEVAAAGTALKVVGRRAVPGLNAGMSGIDLMDGYRTDNGAKMVGAGTELGTIALGTAIGAGLGLLGGPLAPATVPAGAAIGASISGWLSIGTGYAAARMYENRQDAKEKQAQAKPNAQAQGMTQEQLAAAHKGVIDQARQKAAQVQATREVPKLAFAKVSSAQRADLAGQQASTPDVNASLMHLHAQLGA